MEATPAPPLHVVCLKSGTKYPADYANRLHRMVRRHLGVPHTFLCLTDDPRGLDKGILTSPLAQPDLGGTWNKLRFFDPALLPQGCPVLYLDLDVVITGPLAPVLDAAPGASFVGQPDWNRPWFPQFNGSIILFRAGAHSRILADFLEGTASGRLVRREEWDGTTRGYDKTVYWRGWRRFGSDQEWITWHLRRTPGGPAAFPRGLIVSYKAHARRVLPPGASVVVFHGSPKPHEVDHDYVREYWR